MKRVYSTDSTPMAWHVRNVLEQYDIASEVRNTNLYSVAGEIPITECQSEVWVSALYFQRAEQLIKELEQEVVEDGQDWNCANCSEDNLGHYALCWNCQSEYSPDSEGRDS